MILRSVFGVTGEVNASDWAGAVVCTINAQDVTAAATSAFSSPLAQLNGRGMQSGRSLGEELTEEGTGAGAWTTGIDPITGCMWMKYLGGGGAGSFTLTVVGEEAQAFGFGAEGTVLASVDQGGGLHMVTAPIPPLAGTVTNAHITLDPSDGDAFTVPAIPYRAQSVWTLLRSVSGGGSPDADQANAADTLAYRLGLALDTDPTGGRINAGLTDSGYTWIAMPNDIGGTTITWAASTAGREIKKALGFRGDELPVDVVGDVGTLKVWTSTHLNLDAVVTRRAMRAGVELTVAEESAIHRTIDGELVSATTATRKGLKIPFWLQGTDEIGPDLHEHFLAFLDRHPRGAYLELHPRWGDFRRAQAEREVVYHSGAWTRPPYSTLWTSSRNGMVGRRCVRRGEGDATEHTVALGPRSRRIEAELVVEVAEATAYVAS